MMETVVMAAQQLLFLQSDMNMSQKIWQTFTQINSLAPGGFVWDFR